MKTITKKEAEELVTSGQGWVIGVTSDRARWGDEGPTYWIIDTLDYETFHIDTEDAPHLDLCIPD